MNKKLIGLRLKDFLRFFYSKVPMQLKYGINYHKEYKDTYNFLKKAEFWDKEQIRIYQEKKLKKLIKYSYDNVPYYKELFDKNNIKVEEINTIEDLEKIPLLTKDIVKREKEKLISKKINKSDLLLHQTGGSTGKPAKFYFDKLEAAKEQAFVRYIYERIGYQNTNKKNKVIQFSDSILVREEQEINKNCFYKKYPGQNKWYFSYTNITIDTIDDIMNALSNINPDWIISFPSCIYQLAQCLLESNKKYNLNSLKGIIFSSETLYPLQFKVIKKVFKTKFLHVYGHTEHAAMAGTCENKLIFHMEPFYGISEFIECDNNKKELVATGFNNLGMPLIRYKTEDLFILSDEKCDCDREFQIISSIEGRRSDFLYLKNGSKVPDIFCDFVTGDKGNWLEQILRFRIIQKEIGICIIQYIPINNFIDFIKLEKEIKEEVETYFNNQMEIKVQQVQELSKTKRGKDKLIISYLDIKD